MYKVLLVDDEPLALMGIRKTFMWSKYGYEIIGEKTNPVEALEVIERENPDVVFTDIRMPEISGLDLIKKSRRKGINSEFVIISGFSEFTYAQEAIRNGAFDYCLKPLHPEEGKKLLDKLTKYLENKEEKRNIEVLDEILEDNEKIIEVMQLGNIGDTKKYFQAALFTKPGKTVLSKEEIMCTNEYKKLVLPMGTNKLLFVLCYKNEKKINKIENYFNTWKERGLGVGISDISDKVSCISKLIRQADIALSNYFIYRLNDVFRYKNKYNVINNVICPDIFLHLKNKEFSSLQKLFITLPKKFINNKLGMNEVVFLWNQLIAKFSHEWPEIINDKFEFMNYQQILQEFKDFECLCEFLSEIISSQYLSNNSTKEHIHVNKSFKEMLRYIHKHYDQDLYLKDLTSQFYLSISYTCELFKKVTNMSFSAYLSNIRLTKARELLKNSDYSVNEICYKVGYNDYFYFNKIFKKFSGMTPTNFRKNNL